MRTVCEFITGVRRELAQEEVIDDEEVGGTDLRAQIADLADPRASVMSSMSWCGSGKP